MVKNSSSTSDQQRCRKSEHQSNNKTEVQKVEKVTMPEKVETEKQPTDESIAKEDVKVVESLLDDITNEDSSFEQLDVVGPKSTEDRGYIVQLMQGVH